MRCSWMCEQICLRMYWNAAYSLLLSMCPAPWLGHRVLSKPHSPLAPSLVTGGRWRAVVWSNQQEGLLKNKKTRGTPSPSFVSPFWTPKEGRMAPQACPGGMENPTCGGTEPRISNSTASVPNHRASFGSLVSTTCSFNFVEHNSLYIH